MKHLKKLSVAVMMVTLFSVSFTSCIDNEVSPVVEAIYGAQADLLAAQAGVQNAEAAYLLAQANAENAYAAWQTAQAAQVAAITAGIVADNAYEALQHEQDLRALVASTDLAVETAQNALALAQVQFQANMAAAIAAMEAAGAQIAVGYAIDYRNAMWVVNNLKSDKLALEGTLANKQLMLNGGVTWEFYLEGLNSDLSDLNASVAAKQAAIAAYEAYLLDPNTPEAQITAMEAQIAALEEANHDMDVQIEVINNQIQDVFIQMGETSDVINQHNFWTGVLNFHEGLKEGYENANIALQVDIDLWQSALDDYPAALAAFELALSDAETAQADADAAEGVANTALDDANDVLSAAQTVLSDLNAELAFLDASYNDPVTGAIAVYADAQDTYDAGLPAAEAAVDAAELALAAGEAAVSAAQIDYNAKLAAFELNPTGFVWTAGPNGALGLHADATTATDSYREVNSGDNGVLALSLSAGAGIDKTGTYGTYAAFLADATAGTLAPGDYYNVGGDDVAQGTNAERLNAAVATLTAAQDAIAGLEADVTAAELALTNFTQIWLDAKAAFEAQRDLYNGQVTLVADAQADVDAAQAIVDAAQIVWDDAVIALDEADIALAEAQDDLDAFLLLPDEDGLAVLISDANDTKAQNNLLIAEEVLLIAHVQADLDGIEVAYQAALSAPLNAALFVQFLELVHSRSALQDQKGANNIMADQLQDVIDAMGNGNLDSIQTLIDDCNDAIAVLLGQIEAKEVQIAQGEVSVELLNAEIANIQAQIATLTVRIANAQAIADKYKALMDAALAS